jgi:hypothetical protein
VTSNTADNLGTALFELRDLRTLSKLWDGPLDPSHLESIEISLRGFLTAKKLATLKIGNGLYQLPGTMNWISGNNEYFTPFHDHLLDYEFVDPECQFHVEPLESQENTFLSDYVAKRAFEELTANISQKKLNRWQADRYMEMWYNGERPAQCLLHATTYDPKEFRDHVELLATSGDDSPALPFDASQGFSAPLSSIYFIQVQARHLVESHRMGYQVYSSGPLSQICGEHIFSVWPNKLFELASLDYEKICRNIRGPGLGVDLPLITAIVLSRAPSRDLIPRAIVDLRDEYEKSRTQLWELLNKMWETDTLANQHEILADIENAAKSIVPSAFPDRVDSLSLALDFARISVSGLTSGLKELRKRDMPNVRVSAVSFAKQISTELKQNISNTRHILQRHLTSSERRNFGLL